MLMKMKQKRMTKRRNRFHIKQLICMVASAMILVLSQPVIPAFGFHKNSLIHESTARYQPAFADHSKSTSELSDSITIKQDLLSMLLAYPQVLKEARLNKNGKLVLASYTGMEFIYDDGISKNHQQKLNQPDIQDMLEQIYPLKNDGSLQQQDFDPGRARLYTILGETYGKSKTQIEKNLVAVPVLGSRMRFNKQNGAAAALASVMRELSTLIKSNPRVGGYASPCSGTYNYRTIAATGRLSPHAYGIAIDLARNSSDYWKWASREKGSIRIKNYPNDLVQIFERHGFVWGGKWGHFDILHFEYRPELLWKAKLIQASAAGQTWHAAADHYNKQTSELVAGIEKLLGAD